MLGNLDTHKILHNTSQLKMIYMILIIDFMILIIDFIIAVTDLEVFILYALKVLCYKLFTQIVLIAKNITSETV
jgi:hypothetical protein